MIISALIPAFNEEKTIGNVISVLKRCKEISEIIVINDGSQDNTSVVAKSYNVNVVDSKYNLGKGGAICKGLKVSKGDIILILDADLIGLQQKHIYSLLNPIVYENSSKSSTIFIRTKSN